MFKKIMSLFIMISLVMGNISVFAMDVNSNNVDELKCPHCQDNNFYLHNEPNISCK